MGDRILEKTITITFQADPELEIDETPSIGLAEDARLEVLTQDKLLWRTHVLNIFKALDKADATGVVCISANIPITGRVSLGTRPGVKDEDFVVVDHD